MNWSQFFAMGGYALYVWSAYGFAAAVLIINVMMPLRKRTVVMRMLRQLSHAESERSHENSP
jgi:heme exporter protein D